MSHNPLRNTEVDGGGPERKERCSTFITFEWDSEELIASRLMNGSNMNLEKSINLQDQKYQGRVEELTDLEIGIADDQHPVFDFMTQNKKPDHSHNKTLESPKRKGVRVCRSCLAIVMRRQAMTYPMDLPDYIKLYNALKHLQDDIERALPEFQELMINSRWVLGLH